MEISGTDAAGRSPDGVRIRPAVAADIPGMMQVRISVRENTLSDPGRITEADYTDYLFERGRGWVAESGGAILGFAVADLQEGNVWALFVHPDAEGRGLGRRLHDGMLNWYFGRSEKTLWLSTAPGTRAEGFYRAAGWQVVGWHGKDELRLEITRESWLGRGR